MSLVGTRRPSRADFSFAHGQIEGFEKPRRSPIRELSEHLKGGRSRVSSFRGFLSRNRLQWFVDSKGSIEYLCSSSAGRLRQADFPYRRPRHSSAPQIYEMNRAVSKPRLRPVVRTCDINPSISARGENEICPVRRGPLRQRGDYILYKRTNLLYNDGWMPGSIQLRIQGSL
jgi:hypothetical protein